MTRTRRVALVLVGLASSAFFAWLALRKISIADIHDSLGSANYAWLAPTIALTFIAGWVRAVRWRSLFDDPTSITNLQAFGALSIGLMFNNLLPWRAGEVPRVLALRRACGLSGFEVATTIVVERMLDVFVLALGGLALWPFLPDKAWIDVLGLLCAGIVLGSALLVAALGLFRQRLTVVLLAGLRRLPLVTDERAERLRGAIAAGARVLLRPGRLARALGLTLAVWAIVGLSAWALLPAFDLEDVDSLAPWLVLIANSFALVIPSSSAAVGVYEASVQAALVAFGVPATTGLSYALVLHAVNFFPIILVGAVASWVIGRKPPHRRWVGVAG